MVALVACGDSPTDPVAVLEDPATCGGCHSQHYMEWSGSMHAYASEDPVFVAMNNRGERETYGLLGNFCLQCHAPMAVALGLVDGSNGPFDPTQLPPPARGVTCYFCHDVAEVQADHDNGLKLAMDTTMRGGVSDPVESSAHHSKYDPELMASATNGSKMCGSCHDVVTQRGVPLERTYVEWQSTIFAQLPAGAGGITCSGCHMGTNVDPPTTMIVDKSGVQGKSRPGSFHEHLWPGIDQSMTPFAGVDAAAAQAAGIARDLDPALTIVGPAKSGGQIGEGGICVTHDGRITVRMDSRGPGHDWPSGAAHDRRAWLEVIAYDAAGDVVFSSGDVPDDLDPEQLDDPDLVGLWERALGEDGTPAHFIWDVASVSSILLAPPITLDRNVAAFDHSMTASFPIGTMLAANIDHISARVRVRPYPHAVLDDLVASGDLDSTIAANLGTLDIAGADRHWTAADVDPASDGCDRDPYQ